MIKKKEYPKPPKKKEYKPVPQPKKEVKPELTNPHDIVSVSFSRMELLRIQKKFPEDHIGKQCEKYIEWSNIDQNLI